MPDYRSLFASPYHRRELRNYLRYVVRHADFGSVVTAWRAVAARRGGRLPDGLQLPRGTFAGGRFAAAMPFRIASEGPRPADDEIALATRSWNLTDGPPWTVAFEDPEDAFAAHRFGWVLPKLRTRGGAPRCAELAAGWMRANPCDADAPGWDSYSVAERIVHWTYLAAALDGAGLDDGSLVAAVGRHAQWLSTHLELRGPSTNNHLINDARALYVAAVLVGDAGIASLARELLAFATPRMFTAGVLREGSTHYQRLMCRTYVELLMASRAADDEPFAEQIGEWLEAIVSAAEFFSSGASFPLIGDISPDFQPGYHQHVTATARAVLAGTAIAAGDDWAALFGDVGETSSTAAAPSRNRLADAGYYRIDRGHWSVLAYVNPLGHVAPWSHAHADLGAFVASWSGTPLLVDSGRSTYRASAIGEYGRSIRGHNGLSVDGHEPCVAHGHNGLVPLFSASYYAGAAPRATVVENGSALRIEHDGFRRIAPDLGAVRTIRAEGAALTVEDAIEGSGQRRIETFFHFHPEARVRIEAAGVARVETSGTVFRFEAPAEAALAHVEGRDGPNPAGWYSSRYGSIEPCSTLIVTARAQLPYRQRVLLRVL